MKLSITAALFLLLSAWANLNAQLVYADFESAGLTFEGVDGTLTVPVANPAPNQINASANCAKYVKSNLHAYSLLQAERGTSFDLGVNNQFQIDVYATAPTQILFKLQGTGGGFEFTKNIAVTNAWQTYTFDFSAQAANTGLSKVVMFFDPGVETSGDTYYFDNVRAVPNPCVGVAPIADMLDDFSCNRNATYGNGWDSLSVASNPDVSSGNNSSKVGRVRDAAGPGTEYDNLLIDFQNPIDLAKKNWFYCKVRVPKAGRLLLKIEGGPNPAQEQAFDITEVNKWIEYAADFSSQAGKGHRKLVIFFNAGQPGVAGDIYYIDDIRLGVAPPLEDFQGSVPKLGWQGLDQNAPIHGSFQGPVNNPKPGGDNTSTRVGCYTKGGSGFSTLQGILPAPLDLSKQPQLNFDVLSPAAGGKVLVRLNSPTQGNKEAEATITTPGVWQTLRFDFSAFSAITDFGEIRIVFGQGVVASGQVWYLDNLFQSAVTIDPCAAVVPISNIIDDFECQRNYNFGAGADKLTVINNPQLSASNGSLKVGEYKDPANEAYAALCAEFPNGIDLSLYNHLSLQVYGPAKVPVLFKLEGGTSPAKEIWDTLRTANSWYKFDVDFSSVAGQNHKRVCVFLNGGNNNPETIYLIDNLKWTRGAYSGCVSDYQTPASSISNFKYFANGALETAGYQFEIVDNPTPSGINTTSKVGKFVKAGDATTFAGMYADLDAPLDFKGAKTVKAKVLMNHIGNFAVKLEASQTGASNVEISVPNTKINQWEELSINFAAAPDNGEYKRLTIFFDLTLDPTGSNVTSYFDDIVIGSGACTSVGTFSPQVSTLSVSPNPVSDQLWIDQLDGVDRLVLVNLLGQRVVSVNTQGNQGVDLDVSKLPAGVYVLNGYDRSGKLLGKVKLVKQ